MIFIQTDPKTYWRLEDITGVRDEGPHGSININGKWEATEIAALALLRVLEDVPDGE